MHKFVLSCLSACAFFAAAQTAAATPTVTKFASTGAEQNFTVPAGVTSIHVVAIGGKGGIGAGNTRTGGFGAVVSADIAVTPGQVLEVLVAGNGGDAAGTTGGSGGFNNGAAGGSDGQGTEGGGGGGGMSDVLDPSQTFFTGVLVLAAGGGGSGGGAGSGSGGAASDADGKNGQAGGDGDPPSSNNVPTARGGGGGTTSAGGSGGASGGTAGHLAGGGAGTDGNGLIGGAAGGGGGAGRWGGGGGGSFGYSGARAGGGGAGSSTVSATQATNASYTRDTTGVPSITFTYDLPSSPGGPGGNPGGGSGNSPALAPALSGLKGSPRTFVAANRGGSTGGTAGMTISYTSAVAGTTTFTVLAPRRGVTSAARCVKPKRGRHGKRCTRYVSLGSFTHADAAGFNTFVFTGRVRHHKLSRGSYRLQAVSRANGKHSSAVTLAFRIAA